MKIVLLLAAVFLAGQSPVSAQTPAPRGRIQIGPAVSVTPSVVVVGGHDTNFIRTDTGTPASEFWFSPQLQGWVGKGRTRVNFVGALESQYPAAILNNFVSAELQTGSPRLSVSATLSHRDHYAPPTDFVGFEIGIRSRRVERTAAAAAASALGRIRLSANASHSQLRYDAAEVFQGSSLRDNLNRNTTSIGVGAGIALSPLTALSGSVDLFDDRFLFAPSRDGSGYRAAAGFQMGTSALISGYARAGILHYRAKSNAAEFTSPSYTVGLVFARRSLLIDIRGSRDVGYSFDPTRGYMVTDGVDGYLTYDAAEVWSFFVRGSFRGVTPKGAGAELEPFTGITLFKGGFARRIGQWLRLGTDYERYVYGGTGGFSGTRVIGFLMYGSDRLQRLDRPLPGDF